MADNITVDNGSLTDFVVASDECTTPFAGHTQVVKLAISTDGNSTLIPADSTYGLAVDLKRGVPGHWAPGAGVNGTASSTTTNDTSVIAAQGAGVYTYVTCLIVYNASTTDTYVNVKDGTTTKLVVPAPQHAGAVVPLGMTPLRLTANTALQFASGAGVTTMYVSAVGYTSTT